MAELRFEFEWLDSLGVRAPELANTWARLSIAADDDMITKVYDRVAKGVRDSIYVPLYPLAEWFVTNWWFLLGELESPGKQAARDYYRRHCIRFGQEGYAFPALTITPVGDFVQVSWEPVSSEWASVDFIGRGMAYIEKAELTDVLRHFVESVLARLDDQDVHGTLLKEEWAAIIAASPDEKEFSFAAALLGEDPYALPDEDATRIIRVAGLLPPGILTEFFATSTLETLERSARSISESVAEANNRQGRLGTLPQIKRELNASRTPGPPWSFGYALAQRVREVVSLNGAPLPNDGELARALGVSARDYAGAIARVIEAPGVDAVVSVSAEDTPGFAVAPREEQAVRFSFCRSLCEYFSGSTSSVELVTRTYSDQQKANRAFAAEFLAPASILRDVVAFDTVGPDALEDLGGRFGVSPLVIAHQLENHRIARVADR